MAVNKVVLGEDTLIDLTADTVSADKLSKGVTAHDMAGEPIVGTMEAGGGVPDNMVHSGHIPHSVGVQALSQRHQRRADARHLHGPVLLHGSVFGEVGLLARPRRLCDGFDTGRHSRGRAHRAAHHAGERPVWRGVFYFGGHDGQPAGDSAACRHHSAVFGRCGGGHDHIRHIRHAGHRPAAEDSHGVGLLPHADRRVLVYHCHYRRVAGRARHQPLCHNRGRECDHHLLHTVFHKACHSVLQLRVASPAWQLEPPA